MAITNAQQFKQLVNPPMKGKKRPGYRGEAAAASDAAGGRDAGRSDTGSASGRGDGPARGGGRDPSKQYETKTNITKETRDRLKDQRREARYQITPSTRPRNRIFSALASSFIPGSGFLFNRAIDKQAMGFNTPTITDEEDDNFEDRDRGGDSPFIPNMMATPFQQDVIQKTVEELSPIELAIQQRDALSGPRAFAKEGGIMDLETGRQMYFLGKLVKKVTRSVKKIAKSPIGKVALGAAALYGGKKLGLGSMAKNFFTDKALPFIKDKDNLPLLLGAGLTAAPFLFQDDDSDDEYQKFLSQRGASGQGLDIQGIRNDPYNFLARPFRAEGGIMRLG